MKQGTLIVASLLSLSSLVQSWFPKVIVVSSSAFLYPQAYANIKREDQIAKIVEKITVRIQGANSGSGVLVKKEGKKYTVLTAWHVVKDHQPNDEVGIVTFDGREHIWDALSLKRISNVDMAVLTFKSNQNYRVAKIGNAEKVLAGQQIFVAGFPLSSSSVPGRVLRFLKGDVIANARVEIPDGYKLLYSNKTLRGMSGGSVLNFFGELIGIHGRAEIAFENDQGKLIASGTNQGVPISFYKFFSKRQKYFFPKGKGSSIDDLIAKSITLFMQDGKEKEYIQIMDRIIEKVEDSKNNVLKNYIAQAYYFRGSAKLDLLDFKGAIEDYDKSISLDIVADTYVMRGLVKEELEDFIGAIEDYNKAISLDQNHAEAYANRGNSYRDIGNYFDAMSDHNKAIELSSFAKNSRFLEKMYLNRGVTKYTLAKDYEGSIEDYNKAIEINPNYFKAFRERGISKSANGDYEGSIKDFNKAIEINPNYAFSYASRGVAQGRSGNFIEANEDLEKAISLDPNQSFFYHALGLVKQELNDYEGAVKYFNKALEVDPNSEEVYYSMAIINDDLKNFEKAIDYLTQVIQRNPLSSLSFHNRGAAKQAIDLHDDAIKDFDRAIYLEQDKSILYHYYNNRAWSKYKIGKYVEGLKDVDISINLNPEYSSAYDTRGVIKHKMGHYESAIEDFDKAIEFEKEKDIIHEYYNNRAISKYEIGKYKEGLKDVDISINLNPKFSNSFFTRSLIKYKIGDYENACDDMKKSILLGGTFTKEWLEEQGKGCV